jgi:Fur family peroxide stress response transcriptional regulator
MIIKKESVAKHLREHNISPSYPRKRILEYLIERHNHPTVAKIYEDLVEEIPSLSKTTVYNTLKIFVENDIAEEITIEGNEKRYDLYNPDGHGHFRCESCGILYDIDLDFLDDTPGALEGFVIRRQSVHFTGICPACATKTP